jgi:hypothetical protein
VLIDEGVEPREVVLIVDNGGSLILIRGEVNKILGLFLVELDTRSLQVPLHLVNFDVPLALRVQKPECRQHGLGLVGLELAVLQH